MILILCTLIKIIAYKLLFVKINICMAVQTKKLKTCTTANILYNCSTGLIWLTQLCQQKVGVQPYQWKVGLKINARISW